MVYYGEHSTQVNKMHVFEKSELHGRVTLTQLVNK